MGIMKMFAKPNPRGKCPCCGNPILYGATICVYCGRPNDSWRETGEGQCGNCHAPLGPDDRYCRICGTKVGKGAYEPHQDLMECIYGPRPVEREHTCRKCGFKWTTCVMLDDEKYCPKCGGKAPGKEKA